jgi:hypothetical protein
VVKGIFSARPFRLIRRPNQNIILGPVSAIEDAKRTGFNSPWLRSQVQLKAGGGIQIGRYPKV